MLGGLGSSAFSLPLEDVFDVDESAMGVRAKFKSCSPRGNILIVGSRAFSASARQQSALCLTRTSIRERDLEFPMLVRRLYTAWRSELLKEATWRTRLCLWLCSRAHCLALEGVFSTMALGVYGCSWSFGLPNSSTSASSV